ncbi:protein Wnt-7b-like [Centruroides vittatus]|uniref:protein Wnt-7b-like n=1 Tax=Centruroides sculpturatus TaxID=218467 RepID=UPI000C6D7758|nr:protein Wnt-7b-like [Centruroides sculpturatus]
MPRRHRRFFLLVLCFCFLPLSSHFRTFSTAVAFSAEIICNNIPGLTKVQRKMCHIRPDTIVAIGDGVRMGVVECQRQFRHRRWNCTNIGSDAVFGHVIVVGSKEASYIYAINSAAITYAITLACSRGNISKCGCDRTKNGLYSPSGWKWGGCSSDVRSGTKSARKFVDSRELEKDERSLMNLHNNRAGRKAVISTLLTECKCHGVSGSCTMKTCWKTLPSFTTIGDYLMTKYHNAKRVTGYWAKKRRTFSDKPLYLRLKKSKSHRRPKPRDLVYLENSPNYCEADVMKGSLGTKGRKCNKTSSSTDGCDLMCCGRGYNTHQFQRTWQCNCKFHWCCYVKCETCNERTEEYTCK